MSLLFKRNVDQQHLAKDYEIFIQLLKNSVKAPLGKIQRIESQKTKDQKRLIIVLTTNYYYLQPFFGIKKLTAILQSIFKLVGPPGFEPGTNGFWFV